MISKFCKEVRQEIFFTWIMWGVVILGIVGVSAASGFEHTVTGAYARGSVRWLLGMDLYSEGMHGFLYLPHAAIFYSPFAVMPAWLGEPLWRVLMIGSFAYGIYALAGELEKRYVANLFTVSSLVALPMVLDSARNGQMTLLLTGLMLLATRDLLRKEYGFMTVWLVLGFALKPLIVVMFMLIGGVYARTMLRLAIGLVVMFVLPMLMASPSYVLAQYVGFIGKSSVATDPYELLYSRFCDVFGMLRAWGMPVNGELQTLVRIFVALAVWGVCYCGRRMWGHHLGACLILTFSICYLMLFNPRTEINTYSMLSVVLGIYVGWAIILNKQTIIGGCLIAFAVMIAFSYEVVHQLTPGREYWLPPLLTCVFTGYVLFLMVFDIRPVVKVDRVSPTQSDMLGVDAEKEAEGLVMTSSVS
ncbi:DUF2029 domain-containing protein [Planctomycetota bacterium]|nr:DUF2029 domain-containing protein [Planctomycetota bacterium]